MSVVIRVVQCIGLVLAVAGIARAQAPAPPPPRLEASAAFTFLGTSGNASSQSLGAGGEFTWRPDPWTHNGKVVFAQNETEGDLSAQSFAALFRSSRALNERLSAYGQYNFLRDTFAGVEQRHIVEGGLSYLAVERGPHRLRLDGGLGYLYEKAPEDDFDSVTLSAAALYRYEISTSSAFTYEPRFLLALADSSAWRYRPSRGLDPRDDQRPVLEGCAHDQGTPPSLLRASRPLTRSPPCLSLRNSADRGEPCASTPRSSLARSFWY